MVRKRETKAITKLCVREILSLSFVCGAYFFEFRGRNLVCLLSCIISMANMRRKLGRHACALRFSRVPCRPKRRQIPSLSKNDDCFVVGRNHLSSVLWPRPTWVSCDLIFLPFLIFFVWAVPVVFDCEGLSFPCEF